MDEWMRAARAAAPHLAHTLMCLLLFIRLLSLYLRSALNEIIYTPPRRLVCEESKLKNLKCQLTRKTDMTLTVPGPTVTLGPTAPEPSRSYRA